MRKADLAAAKGAALDRPRQPREAVGPAEHPLFELQRAAGNRAVNALLGLPLQRQGKEEEEVQTKPEATVQRQAAPEEEEQVQAQAEEEEEKLQPKGEALQRQSPKEEEEEPLQAQADEEEVQAKVQRQEAPEEEAVQTTPEAALQRQPEEEEQVQAQSEEEEEAAPQAKATLQRQEAPEEEEVQAQPQEEEEPLQAAAEAVVQRQEAPEEEEVQAEDEEAVQGKAEGPQVSRQVMGAIDARRGGGQALPGEVRQQAEAGVGYDFKDVRIHTDSEADGLAAGLQAKAFTTGKDIFFRAKDYAPGSQAGRELIGHELTHVVQQHQGLSEPAGRPGDRYEQEADRVGAAVFGKEAVPICGDIQGECEMSSGQEHTPQNREAAAEPEKDAEANSERGQVQQETDTSPLPSQITPVIQCWGPAEHKKITKAAVAVYLEGSKVNETRLDVLAEKSNDMDERAEELDFNASGKYIGIGGTRHSERTHKELVAHYEQHKGLAKDHGEGGLYKSSEDDAASINEPHQRMYEAQFDQPHNFQGKMWALGNALHVAQDRGSHGEGAQNMGHDGEIYTGTNPDEPGTNKTGQTKALNLSTELLRRAKGLRELLTATKNISWTKRLINT